jgi:hypothetical protein
MTVLTNQDYGKIRDIIYRLGWGKEELKALSRLPNKSELKAAFQAIEDSWVANEAGMKSDLDTALSQTTTNAFAKKFAKAWAAWRFK